MNSQVITNNSIDINQKAYVQYIDVLRILSMLSVVFLHTAAGSLRVNLGSSLWHFSNILTTVMSTSVPIFFMISGAMLLSTDKTLSISYTYKVRLPKAFIPFAAWSVVAVVYYGLLSMHSTGNFDVMKKMIKNIVSTPAAIHLWFMYALIPLYILSPLLKKLVDSMSPYLTKYFIILWFVFSSLLPTISSLVPAKISPVFTLNRDYNLNFLNGYIGYFILGYYLFNLKKKISTKLLLSVIIADTALIAIGTFYKTMQFNQYSELFKVYSKSFILILSASVFLFVRELIAKYPIKQYFLRLIKMLSAMSFGVYLMHNLLIDALNRFTTVMPVNSILKLLISYSIILVLTFIFIVIVSSIKYTCFIFTGLSYKSACKSCNIQFFIGLLKKTVSNFSI